MSGKQLPMYMNYAIFKEKVVNWSDDKIRREIQNNGMPAVQLDNGRYNIGPSDELMSWFKRRKVRAG